MSKKKICYFYDTEIGNYYYGQGHPMKPHRIRMAHNLLANYGLLRKMDLYRPPTATELELTKFHTDDYISFLKRVTPEAVHDVNNLRQLKQFNLMDTDCPVFDGIWNYCQSYTGASVAGAVKLNNNITDICVNWSGGLHHAKKCEASGFCYVNDIVLAILELLKVHQRVLYIDVDIHHGDGVEEAFYTTDRVMTVSFHKFGEYFPGTGDVRDIGASKGKMYSLNFPLRDGIDDESYREIFRPIMTEVMNRFQPGVIVYQSGADSLSGDRLGCFNLSVKGHGECLDFMQTFGVPMLVLGGGGYTIRNVSRCWAYETSVVLKEPIENDIPYNDFYEYYGPDFKLHLTPSNMENLNTADYLDKVKVQLFENLKGMQHAPSVQMHQAPEQLELKKEEEDPDKTDPNDDEQFKRHHEAEFYDGTKDNDKVNGNNTNGEAAGAAATEAKPAAEKEETKEPEKTAPAEPAKEVPAEKPAAEATEEKDGPAPMAIDKAE